MSGCLRRSRPVNAASVRAFFAGFTRIGAEVKFLRRPFLA
jgi:hypothetical protein